MDRLRPAARLETVAGSEDQSRGGAVQAARIAVKMAKDDSEKQDNVLQSFLSKVDSYLPSKAFHKDLKSPEIVHPSTMSFTNRIGLVCGETTARRLGAYCAGVPLAADQFPEAPVFHDLDVLLIVGEVLTREDPWRAALLDLDGKADHLRRIVRAARQNKVPVVFWLREEKDAIGLFAHLVDLADIVALPPGCAETGRRSIELGAHADVKVFNPVTKDLRATENRAPYLRHLVDGYFDIAMGYGDGVFERWASALLDENWWGTDSTYLLRNNDRKISAALRRRFVGSLQGEELSRALKLARSYVVPGAKIVQRPLHAERLVLNAAASKTVAVTDLADPQIDLVRSIPDPDDLAAFLKWMREDSVGRNAAQHRAWREAVGQRSLFEAIEALLSAADVKPRLNQSPSPHINIVVPTIRPELIPFTLANIDRQVHDNLSATIVVNGRPVPEDIRRLVEAHPLASLLYLPADKTIGYCINLAVDHGAADYWAKFDDDDLYGAHYLSDMMLQRKYADFEITGKGAIFTYFEELDKLHIRRLSTRDSYLHYIGGGTILAKGSEIGFPEDVRGYADTLFLTRAAAEGQRILAADPFNFIQIRRADPTSHTWTAGREELNLLGPSRHGIDFREVLV